MLLYVCDRLAIETAAKQVKSREAVVKQVGDARQANVYELAMVWLQHQMCTGICNIDLASQSAISQCATVAYKDASWLLSL